MHDILHVYMYTSNTYFKSISSVEHLQDHFRGHANGSLDSRGKPATKKEPNNSKVKHFGKYQCKFIYKLYLETDNHENLHTVN